MDIDAVYTWVDGADESWQAKKSAALGLAGVVDPSAHHAVRFRDAGEIRHSIVSIVTHAPWVRRIFVVTDSQCPPWLNDFGSRITLVDHREIFSNLDWLPCYAARGIESQLHRIPGLADRFLYFNDDMFLGRSVRPEDFFDSLGRPKVFTCSRRPRPQVWHAKPHAIPNILDMLHSASVERSRLLVRETIGVLVSYDVRHQVKAISRPLMLELEKRYQCQFELVASTPFRSTDTINPFYLHAFYGIATGQATPSYVRSVKEFLSWKDVLAQIFGFGDSCMVILSGERSISRLQRVAQYPPRFVCINQNEDTSDSDLERMSRVLNELWPLTGRSL